MLLRKESWISEKTICFPVLLTILTAFCHLLKMKGNLYSKELHVLIHSLHKSYNLGWLFGTKEHLQCFFRFNQCFNCLEFSSNALFCK